MAGRALEKLVADANVFLHDRDDDLRVYTVDLSDTDLRCTVDVEARGPADARKKALAFLAEQANQQREPGA